MGPVIPRSRVRAPLCSPIFPVILVPVTLQINLSFAQEPAPAQITFPTLRFTRTFHTFTLSVLYKCFDFDFAASEGPYRMRQRVVH